MAASGDLYWARVKAGKCTVCGEKRPKSVKTAKGDRVPWKLRTCPQCAENERFRVLAIQYANRAHTGRPFPAYPYPK
jgi:hypothetical protein